MGGEIAESSQHNGRPPCSRGMSTGVPLAAHTPRLTRVPLPRPALPQACAAAHDLRSAATVLLLVTFAGIVVWAWSGRRKPDFDAAAELPLVDDAPGTTPFGEKQ